ncbi:MAG: efflux RND transporter periplasmic adaptor subunit [Steroidobacteraceae bacterium]|nr:efflux RND transporter periplasmic adaptor subunit [Steroidobacteraceae bacterium]
MSNRRFPTASVLRKCRPLSVAAMAALLAVQASPVDAQVTTPAKAANGARGVAALGRLEPEGGIARLGLPSTPEAISGAVLTRIHVQRGADVQAGQVLAEADTVPVLKAHLAEARADLETARRDARAAASLADEACVLADVAARQSKRQVELLSRKLTSDDVADQARGAAEAGAAACKARRAAASVADSRIASAEAVLTRRQAELDRAFVRAPFAGRILDFHAKVGELVSAEGVCELGRVDQMYAIAEVYETDIRHVKVGQKARVRSEALAKPLTGTVTRIRPKVHKLDEIGTDPAARKDARIIEVEVKLDDSAAVASLSLLQVEVEIGR